MKKILPLLLCALLPGIIAYAQPAYKYVYKAEKLWLRSHDSKGFNDFIYGQDGLTLDDSDNIYVAGAQGFDESDQEWMVLRYNPDGKLKWTYTDSASSSLNTSAIKSTYAKSVVWNPLDSGIYVMGTLMGFSPGFGDVTSLNFRKLSRSYSHEIGNTYYSLAFNGGSFSSTVPQYTRLDENGDMYFVGNATINTSGSRHSGNMFAVQYDPRKRDLTKHTYHPPGWAIVYDSAEYFSEGQQITLDKNGEFYVAGISQSFFDSTHINTHLITWKYDTAGNLKWTRQYVNLDTVANTNATGIALDSKGSVYVCGNILDSRFKSSNGVIIKYSSKGKMLWQKYFTDALSKSNSANCNAMTIDKNDNVYVAGFIGTAQNQYAALEKLDSSGKKLWLDTLTDKSEQGVSGNAITMLLDDTGNVYVAGNQTFSNSQGIYASRYDAGGQMQWYILIDSSDAYNDVKAIRMDKRGNIILAGIQEGVKTGADALLLKLKQTRSQVITSLDGGEEAKAFCNIYPNPFSSQLHIDLTLAEQGNADIKLFDITGRKLQDIQQNNINAGSHHLTINGSDLSPGIYLYTCHVSSQSGHNSTLNGKLIKQQ